MTPGCRCRRALLPALLALLLVPLLAGTARGQSDDDRRQAKLLEKEAYKLFEQKDYLAAAAKLRQVHGLLHHWGYLWNIGVALEKGGDTTGACAAFERLAANPEATPEKKAEAQAKLLQLQPRLVGGLALTCRPDDARFEVTGPQGVSEGRCPWRQEGLRAGKYTVRVTADGYRTSRQEVEVAPGAPLTLEVQLAPADGRLAVFSSVAGATVVLDGRTVGTTPDLEVDVAPGSHAVEVHFPDGETWKKEVEVQPDQQLVLQAHPAGSAEAEDAGDGRRKRAAGGGASDGPVVRLAAWASAGAGVLAAGAGLLLWLHADGLHDRFDTLARERAALHEQGNDPAAAQKGAEATGVAGDFATYRNLATDCFVAAGVAAAASGALFVWSGRSAPAAAGIDGRRKQHAGVDAAAPPTSVAWTVAPQLLPGGGGLLLWGAY